MDSASPDKSIKTPYLASWLPNLRWRKQESLEMCTAPVSRGVLTEDLISPRSKLPGGQSKFFHHLVSSTPTSTFAIMGIISPLHRVVPPEITSGIFAFDVENGRDPTELALVCKHWKEITYATRLLWSTVSLDLKTSTTTLSNAYRRFQISHPYPFSLDIRTGCDSSFVLPEGLTSLIETIAPRLVSLSFIGSQSSITRFTTILPPCLPLLNDLRIQGQGSANFNIFYPNRQIDLSNIRSLSLDASFYPGFCRLFRDTIPWSDLTSLTIIWPQASMPNLLLYIFACQNLVECHLHVPFTSADFSILPEKEYYHLNHLRILHLNLCNTDVVQLLDYLCVPALQQLELELELELELASTYRCLDPTKEVPRKLMDLYERCPFELESLTLNRFKALDVGLCIEFVERFKSLKRIRVDGLDALRQPGKVGGDEDEIEEKEWHRSRRGCDLVEH